MSVINVDLLHLSEGPNDSVCFLPIQPLIDSIHPLRGCGSLVVAVGDKDSAGTRGQRMRNQG